MLNYTISNCPRCGKKSRLMYSNNPLSGPTICFNCIAEQLDPNNIEHGEFFCRTYNLPWLPDLWLNLLETTKPQSLVFESYTTLVLEDEVNKPNLYYSSSTKDL